ncbi:ribonuclease III [Ilumatobacter nonamiensis]|uniref:ribonuclease III n=1 Tax=Ilumatobacter nonamiensis TaxID=467093 RepID=UPI00034C67E0|nr:ribonuclease III [Ilumatobacter nonamiensis]
MDLDELSERIGYRFERVELLDRALAHRSWCAEHDGADSNERLEFLGDAVLGWAIADIAYRRFDDLSEGRLTDLRKSVVNAHTLASVAGEIGLGAYIKLGRGEAAADGAGKPSILSDAFEAVLGAVYLDGGTEAAFDLVERHVATRLAATIDGLGHLDWKTELQERCARHGRPAPEYQLTSTGPDHEKVFTAVVRVGDDRLGTGEGRSKKAAEQIAAEAACRVLD